MANNPAQAGVPAPPLGAVHGALKKCEIAGEKMKMSARRHFWGWGYPRVFAYVGETKELQTGRVYRGETLDLGEKEVAVAGDEC